MGTSILRFEPNMPVQLALKYQDGKEVESQFGGTQLLFTLVDGRTMYVPPIVGDKIDELSVAAGEPITVTKAVTKGKGGKDKYEWRVERAAGPVTVGNVVFAPKESGARPASATPATSASLPKEAVSGTTTTDSNAGYAADLMLLEIAGRQAIDAVLRVQRYAQAKLRPDFEFDVENVMKLWITGYIQGSKQLFGGGAWKS